MRVWFNHWFSTAFHLINLIKRDNPGKFVFIGSNYHASCIYRRACDGWYQENEKIPDNEYADYAVDFCREHRIDLFVPKRGLANIVKNYSRFAEIGVKILADNRPETIVLLEDKQQTYDSLKKCIPDQIPEYRIVRSIGEFLDANEELRSVSTRICYKLVIDEGAMSFRVLDNQIENLAALRNSPGKKITVEAAKKVLENYDFSAPILLMPFLEGTEISADCLATGRGNLVIPRYKTTKRYSEVIFNPNVMAVCEKIMNFLQLKTPLNIQFKMQKEKCFLLEINPRMSGGLQLSCEATGINLPSVAVRQLLGWECFWKYPEKRSQRVANIETPICVD